MAIGVDTSRRSESEGSAVRFLPQLDLWLALVAAAILLLLILSASRANIVADSVDYYAILQQLTSPTDKPIVRNLHFVEQRSPGYPLAALIPYAVLSLVVDPFVSTEKVANTATSTRPPGSSGERPTPPKRPAESGSEFMPIPPGPLLLRQVPFNDIYIPAEGSWYRWKPVLALALTSYLFLFGGMAASARALGLAHPDVPLYCLVPAAIFASPIFMHNIIATPLYATLTAYGASSLFVLAFVEGYTSRRTRELLVAGLLLGVMFLTRLEVGVFAAALTVLLLVRKEWRVVAPILGGSIGALVVWVLHNLAQFSTPIHLGVLRGDINRLALDAGFVFENLAHPSSGVLFWSPLLALGLAGLVVSRSRPLRLLGISSLALLAVYLVRVPIMYQHVGAGLIDIGGIPVTVPSSPTAMRELVRSDINRYVTVMIPAAVLGLRDGIAAVQGWWISRQCRKTAST